MHKAIQFQQRAAPALRIRQIQHQGQRTVEEHTARITPYTSG